MRKRVSGIALFGAGCLVMLSACSSATTSTPSSSVTSATPATSQPSTHEWPGGAVPTDKIVLANIQPDDSVSAVIDFIASAKKTLDIAVYQIDPAYTPLIEALKAAQARGVKVRILISGTIYPPTEDNNNPVLVEDLREEGFDAQLSRPEFSYSHWKLLIADGGTPSGRVLLCDYNLEAGYFGLDPQYPTEGDTRGMAVLVSDSADVDLIQATFDADWPPYKPWPISTRPNLVWSPSDDTCDTADCTGPFVLEPVGNSTEVLTALINDATTSLDVYAQALAKPSRLLQPLLDAAGRGVKVRIVGNDGGINTDAQAALKAAGVQTVINTSDPTGDGKVMYIHTKTIIADADTDRGVAYVGSVNPFLDESLATERELGVFVTDPASIAKILSVFNRDFDNGSPV